MSSSAGRKFGSGQQIVYPTGNWSEFRDDTNGDTNPELDQDRVHNKANEIDTDDVHGNGPGASITATTGTNWGDPLYDANGNGTSLPKPSSPANTYTLTYDAWNRLVLVEESGGADVAGLKYDGLNRRVSETNVSDTRHYYYYSNRWQVLEERNVYGTYVDRQNVWGLRYIDDLVLRDYDFDGNPATGDLGIADSGLERRRFAMQDAQFNLVAGVSTAGVVQERFTYTPYGAPEFRNQYFAPSTNTQDWQTLYAGYQYDPETGLYCVRNRYYHALTLTANRDTDILAGAQHSPRQCLWQSKGD